MRRGSKNANRSNNYSAYKREKERGRDRQTDRQTEFYDFKVQWR